jgi:hypothetical protein
LKIRSFLLSSRYIFMFFNFKILRKTATFPPPELHRYLNN